MKHIVLAILLSLGVSASFAQEVYTSSGRAVSDDRRRNEEEGGFDPSKMIYGGGLAFGIGGGVTNIGISPIVGYRFTEDFSAGIGLGYNYLQIKNFANYYNANGQEEWYTLKTSIYTANVWARYLIWENIFLHVQPEMNSLETLSAEYVSGQQWGTEIKKRRLFVPSMLVGGGIRQPISDRASFVAVILYDVLQDKNSPYRNTVDLRFGFAIGF